MREAQQSTIDRLKNELEAAKSATSKVMSAEQFGDAITIFFSRTADIARQPFDDMPAGVVGAFLDQVGRIERFCADLRAVMSGD